MNEFRSLWMGIFLIFPIIWLLYYLFTNVVSFEGYVFYGWGVACSLFLSVYYIGEFFIIRHVKNN